MTLIPYAGQDRPGSLRAHPDTVLSLFRQGLDTKDISARLSNTTEAHVYALLHIAMAYERRTKAFCERNI